MKKSSGLSAFAFLLICFFSAYASASETALRFEPTVSREESELLSEARNVAQSNLVAAIDLVSEKLEADSSAALDFALGNFHYQRDELDPAAEFYRAALEKLPYFKSAIANLGRVYILRNKPKSAIDLYRKLVEAGVASSENYLLLGQAHLLAGNSVSAESAFRQLLLLDPGNAAARRGLVRTLLDQERYRESRSLLEELLEDAPEDGELWSLRANLALALDSAAEALAAIEAARRLGLAAPQMLASLGDIYLNRGQAREAVAAYKESFAEQAPSFRRLTRSIEGMIAVGDLDSAQEMIAAARAIAENENEQEKIRLLELEASIALARGDEAAAGKLYESILKLDPLRADALLGLAEIDWRQNRLEAAIIACERAARIEGHAVDALVLQAQIEVERENYRVALRLLEKAQSFREQEHVARYLKQLRRLAEQSGL